MIFVLREAKWRPSPSIPAGPSCWKELRIRPGCLCYAVPLLSLTQFYWTGLLVYPWSICRLTELLLPANLWTELQISRQHRQALVQRTFLNRSTSPISFLFHHFLVGGELQGRLKSLRTIIKTKVCKIKVTGSIRRKGLVRDRGSLWALWSKIHSNHAQMG